MRQSSSVAVFVLATLALGCEGQLIDRDFPTTPSPPPASPPALAFRVGDIGADVITDMAVDPAGNIYLTGTFTGTVDFNPAAGIDALTSLGSSDVFVSKFSPTGVFAWVARIGGAGSERVTGIVSDAVGNVYLGGGFDGSTDFDPGAGSQILTSQGAEDGFVVKLSSLGELLWHRRIGGPNADYVSGVAVDPQGRSYATGNFSGAANPLPEVGPTLTGNGTAQDAFLVGFDAAGAISFAFPLGGTQADVSTAIAVTTGGVVVVGGTFRGSASFLAGSTATQLTSLGGVDAFLAGYSTFGVLQWARALGGLGDEDLRAGGLAADATGGIVATGTFTGTVDFDGGAPVANRTSIGATDWYAVRYDGAGAFLAAFSVGALAADPAPRPAVDIDGGVLVTGGFSGAVDFDPGTPLRVIASLGSGGATDVFTAKYTSGGGLVWVSTFGEGTSVAERQNLGAAIAAFPAGGVLVSGLFFGSPDFDPGSSVFRLTSLGSADGFVVRLTSAGALSLTP